MYSFKSLLFQEDIYIACWLNTSHAQVSISDKMILGSKNLLNYLKVQEKVK